MSLRNNESTKSLIDPLPAPAFASSDPAVATPLATEAPVRRPPPTIDPMTDVSSEAVTRDATAQARKPCAVSRKYTSSVFTSPHFVLSRPAR